MNAYICDCVEGWTGTTCEVDRDECVDTCVLLCVLLWVFVVFFFFFQAEDGIRDSDM